MSSKTSKIGWTISILLSLLLIFTSIMDLMNSADLQTQMAQFGYPAASAPLIGVALLVSTLLYLFRRTSVLGVVLLTGYFGGAVATHVRMEQDLMALAPIAFCVLLWVGVGLREKRIRDLMPLVK